MSAAKPPSKRQQYLCPGGHSYSVPVEPKYWVSKTLEQVCLLHFMEQEPAGQDIEDYITQAMGMVERGELELRRDASSPLSPAQRLGMCLSLSGRQAIEPQWLALLEERPDWGRAIKVAIGPAPVLKHPHAHIWDRFFDAVVVEAGVRFPDKVQTPCWWWVERLRGATSCMLAAEGGEEVRALDWAYGQIVGEIAEGGRLDLRCCNLSCVNPYHAELAGQARMEGVKVKAKKKEQGRYGDE